MGGRPVFRQVRSAISYGRSGYGPDPADAGFRDNASTGLLPAFVANLGILNANESALMSDDPSLLTTHVIPSGEPGYEGEVYVAGATGSAAYAKWTPMRLEIDVALDGPGHLVVNQNWDAGWRCEGGRPVERYVPLQFIASRLETGPASRAASRADVGGVIAVRVRPEDKKIVLYYDPPSFRWGVATFALTSLTAAGIGVASLKRRRKP
jgi:hypothetical protein